MRCSGQTEFRNRDLLTKRGRSEEHTSELQSPCNIVCRLLLEKKKSPHLHVPDCCSAMLTSKYRSWNSSENRTIPDPSRLACVMPTSHESSRAISQRQSPTPSV